MISRLKSPLVFSVTLIGLILLTAGFSAAQNRETDRVTVYVFLTEERPEDAVLNPELPSDQWQLEPLAFGPQGNAYYFDLQQAEYLGTQLIQQLQRTGSRRELIKMVGTPVEAMVLLEIVATRVQGEIQGRSVGVGGQSSGSTVTTMAFHDVLIARLTIPNHVYTTDFLGTKVDALRTPAVVVAEQVERFIKSNADGLREANPQRP